MNKKPQSKTILSEIYSNLSRIYIGNEGSFLCTASTIIFNLDNRYILKFKFLENGRHCTTSIFCKTKKETIDNLDFLMKENTTIEDFVEDMTTYINYVTFYI